MKVRHKDKHYIVGEVFQESPSHYLVYLPNTESDSPLYAYPKTTFEPVPTDRWQDVTGECEIASNGDVWHVGLVFLAEFHGRYTYRLRKVQVGSIITGDREVLTGHEQVRLASTEPQWAFRVERKVSE